MCLYVLMVGATSGCARVPVADTLPTSYPCVDIFHVDLRDSVEQRVRRTWLMNRVDLVQLGGQVPNPKDRYTAVRRRGCKTRNVRQNRFATVSDRTKRRARLEETHHSGVGRAGQEITISSGVCCRSGSGPASSWWKNVSGVSFELERADDPANSVCAQ